MKPFPRVVRNLSLNPVSLSDPESLIFNLLGPWPAFFESAFPKLAPSQQLAFFCCCFVFSGEKVQSLFIIFKETLCLLPPPPLGHCESQSLSTRTRDVAFSPEDWKESFKTSFGFIFQRLGLGILRPEDVAWRGDLGGGGRSEGKQGAQESCSYPSLPPQPKNNLQRKPSQRGQTKGRLPQRWVNPPVVPV